MRYKLGVSLFVFLVVIVIGYFGIKAWKGDSAVPKIAVVLPSSVNQFWIEVKKGAEEARSEFVNDYNITIAETQDIDPNGQNELLENFLVKDNINALVLGPASDSAPIPVLAKYTKKGIPIITIDTLLLPEPSKQHGVDIAAFIGSNNVEGGEKAAKVMSEALDGSSMKVLLIEGSRAHQSAIDRTDGFLKVAKEEGLKVTVVSGEWKFEQARDLVNSNYAREHFDGIFANNDVMALGAIAGLKAMNINKEKWPVIIGFDATEDAYKAIEKGEMYKTVKQDPRLMGKLGVQTTVKVLKNKPDFTKKTYLPVSVAP